MKKKENVIYVDQESDYLVSECLNDTQKVVDYFKNKKNNLNYRFIVNFKENDNKNNQFKINVNGSRVNIFLTFNLDKGIFEQNISFDISDIFVQKNEIYFKRENSRINNFSGISIVELILNIALKYIVLEQTKKYLFKKSENFINSNYKKFDWIDNSNVRELDKIEASAAYLFEFEEELKLKKKEYALNELIITEEVLDEIVEKVTLEDLKSQPIHVPFYKFTYVMQDNIKLQCDYTTEGFLKIILYSKYDKHLATLIYNTSDNSCRKKITPRFKNYFQNSFENNDDNVIGVILIEFFYFLYFLNNYHVKKFKEVLNKYGDYEDIDDLVESSKRISSNKENVDISIPRKRYICTFDDVKSARKSSKPIYSVKEWPRSGHYRKIRDKETGEIKKMIFIEPQNCVRRKVSLVGEQKCKKTYLMNDIVAVKDSVLS